LAAIFSVTLVGCSNGATPAAAPAATTGSAQAAATQVAGTASKPAVAATQAAPSLASGSTALIVGALQPKPFSGLAGSIAAIRFSPDGKILAAGGQDPFVQLWDVTSGQVLKTLKSPAETRDFNLRTIAFSPDGTRVAKDGPPLVVWDVASGKALFEKWVFNSADSGGGAAAIAFSPDGKILAAGDSLSLQLLDASTGAASKVLVDVKGSTQSAATTATRSLVFSPDGQTLASAGPANVVTLWTVSSGQQAATLTGTATQINSVAFSPDGEYLAGGGQDDITVWELPAATSPRTLVHESNQHSAFNSVGFSADGKYLAGTSIMGLDLWAVSSWQSVPITTGLNQGVRDAFALSPDSQLLAGVASGQDHIVRAWPLEPAPVTGAAAAPVGVVPPAPVGAPPGAPAGARPNLTPATGARPAAAKPPDFDVCTLVTQPEAEAMLGAPVISHESNPGGCRYAAADGSSVGVDSAGGASAEYSKLMFDTTHQMAPTVKDISGLGDKAFSTGTDDFCCALYVLKGSTLFEVIVEPFDRGFQNGAPTDKLLILANKAASRL
jgi:roadblock/LC7 domain-containing protein